MTFCVNSGVAFQAAQGGASSSVYSMPTYIGLTHLLHPRLTAAEYNAIDWSNSWFVYIYDADFMGCVFRNNMSLSTRLPDASRIYFWRHAQADVRIIQARIRQSVALTLYNRVIERRTAMAMALHARLGGDSKLGSLGRDLMSNVLLPLV
jgi:hypothetical protein